MSKDWTFNRVMTVLFFLAFLVFGSSISYRLHQIVESVDDIENSVDELYSISGGLEAIEFSNNRSAP